MKEFIVFDKLAATPGKNDKVQLLKDNDTPNLRRLLTLCYDKFRTYRIKSVAHPNLYNKVQPDITDELEMLLNLLAEHKTGTNEAKSLIKNLLARCTEDGAKWVTRIILRDLKVGIDEKTINKAFKGLIPTFDVQLAHPIYSGGKAPVNRWTIVKYPTVVEEKLDGVRCVATVRNGTVVFQSREGHEFNDRGVFSKEILKLCPGADFVLDGEIIAFKFNPNNKVAVKNKDDNWPYEQAKSMLKDSDVEAAEFAEYVGYYVWDIIDIDYFDSQGENGIKETLETRKLKLIALFKRNDLDFKNLFLVPNAIAHNESEVKELFSRVRNKGGQKYSVVDSKGRLVDYTMPKGEGVMVKDPRKYYEFSRTEAVLKVKEFYTCDLRIYGAYEGEAGSKFEGMLGGLNMGTDCGTIKTDCGSGFDDLQRYELWKEYNEGTLVGKIAEVSYQEITADGSLRFPVFIRFRDDKTETSVG